MGFLGKCREKQLGRLADCIDRGVEHVRAEQKTIREYVEDIDKVAATSSPPEGRVRRIARRSSKS